MVAKKGCVFLHIEECVQICAYKVTLYKGALEFLCKNFLTPQSKIYSLLVGIMVLRDEKKGCFAELFEKF